jgi:CMP-2-keto-3-deoxyoctulosonic acid synthetase
MVQWVYEHASQCPTITHVVVATDSPEVMDCVQGFGGEARMTAADIPNGTTRAAVVSEAYPDMQVIINLQGDEPFVTPTMLDTLVTPFFTDPSVQMTTLASPIQEVHFAYPTTVKVLTDLRGNAIYFSRAPIPYRRHTTTTIPVYHHKGVYAYQRNFLSQYHTLPQTPLDAVESLEQLRVIEHGYRIRVCVTPEHTLEINTPEELELAQSFYAHASDTLVT